MPLMRILATNRYLVQEGRQTNQHGNESKSGEQLQKAKKSFSFSQRRFRDKGVVKTTYQIAKKQQTEDEIESFVKGFSSDLKHIKNDSILEDQKAVDSDTDKFVPWIVSPDNKYKLIWDAFGLMLVLFYTVVVPLRIAFGYTVLKGKGGHSFVTGTGGWKILDIFADVYFIYDILITFRTAVPTGMGELVTDWQKIAKKYIKFWLPIDCFASFPLTLLEAVSPTDFEGSGQANKLLRSLKVLKLFRMFRIPRLYKALERRKIISPALIRLSKLLIVYLVVLHCLACGYWYVSQTEGFCIFQDPDGSPCMPEFGSQACGIEGNANLSAFYAWNSGKLLVSSLDSSQQLLAITKSGYYECADAWVPWAQILLEDFETQYLQAFFWALVVSTGIGYDILPKSNPEVTYTILCTFIGVFLYAFIIGSIPGVIQQMEGEQLERRRELDFINDFLKKQHVPSHVTKDINNYMDFVDTVNKEGGARLLDRVILHLPQSMGVRLKVSIYWKYVRNMELFQNVSPKVIVKLIEKLKSYAAIPGEVLLVQGSCEGFMFIVRRGCVHLQHKYTAVENWARLVRGILKKHLLSRKDDGGSIFVRIAAMQYSQKHSRAALRVLKVGEYAGEDMLSSSPHYYGATSISYSDLMILDKEDLRLTCKQFPSLEVNILSKARKRKIDFGGTMGVSAEEVPAVPDTPRTPPVFPKHRRDESKRRSAHAEHHTPKKYCGVKRSVRMTSDCLAHPENNRSELMTEIFIRQKRMEQIMLHLLKVVARSHQGGSRKSKK